MSYSYYVVTAASGTVPIFNWTPAIPSGIAYEAKSYDTVNMICKIKVDSMSVIPSGLQITEQQYLEN